PAAGLGRFSATLLGRAYSHADPGGRNRSARRPVSGPVARRRGNGWGQIPHQGGPRVGQDHLSGATRPAGNRYLRHLYGIVLVLRPLLLPELSGRHAG